MKKELRYGFHYIEFCNMCGDSTTHHKILGKRLNRSQGRLPWKKTGITTTVCRCASCGLVYSNPQPVPFDIQDHYGVPPEDYWIPEYFQVDKNYFAGQIAKVKTLLDFKPGMKALDVGAGLGKAMIAMSDAGFDAYGFEPSLPFYENAIQKMGIDKDKLKLGMIETLEYPDNYFDFISFGVVLEHLYDPSSSLEKALRWLKPGGIIHIEVPSSDWLVNKLVNFYYWFRGSDYVSNISPMHVPFHLYEFSIKSFREHAKKNSYDIKYHGYYVCETYLPKIFDFVLQPYMKWTRKGMLLVVYLGKK